MNRIRLAVRAAVATVALGAVTFFAPTAASASSCGITVGGHAGSYVCEYPPRLVQWPDGHYQWFVVGTDSSNSIYDTYQLSPGSSSWSNWRNLGGTGRSGVGVSYLSSSRITIDVTGTYNGLWCKTWTSSTDWGSWFDC